MKNNFELVHDTKSHYHIKSPAGKTFTIEKEKLKPEAHQMIKMMCGGSVKGYSGEDGSTVEAPEEMDAAEAAPAEEQAAPKETAVAAKKQEEKPDVTEFDISDPNKLYEKSLEAQNALYNQQIEATKKYQQQVGQAFQGTQNIDVGLDPLVLQNQEIAGRQAIQQDQESDQKLMDSVLNQKAIDPDHYWKNQSTGSKIAASLGLILAGAGAGRGGRNLAADNINQAIQNDIVAQYQDQSKSMNLWKMNRDKLSDDRQALLATHNQMLTLAQTKLARYGAQIGNAQAQLGIADTINKLQQQKISNRYMLGAMKGMGGGAGEQSPAEFAQRMISNPEQLKEANKEIADVQKIEKLRDEWIDSFNKVAKLHGDGILDPSVRAAEINALGNTLVTATDHRFNESAAENIVNGLFPGYKKGEVVIPDSENTVQEKFRKGLRFFDVQRPATPVLDGNHIPAHMFKATSSDWMSRKFTPQQRQAYLAAKSMPDHPKAKETLKRLGYK